MHLLAGLPFPEINLRLMMRVKLKRKNLLAGQRRLPAEQVFCTALCDERFPQQKQSEAISQVPRRSVHPDLAAATVLSKQSATEYQFGDR